MNIHSVLRALNIAVRAAFIVIGILMIVGYFQLRYVSPHFRILLGVIFILYGVFRIATLSPKREVGQHP